MVIKVSCWLLLVERIVVFIIRELSIILKDKWLVDLLMVWCIGFNFFSCIFYCKVFVVRRLSNMFICLGVLREIVLRFNIVFNVVCKGLVLNSCWWKRLVMRGLILVNKFNLGLNCYLVFFKLVKYLVYNFK